MLCKFFPYGDTCMENMQDGLRGQVQPIIGHKVLVRHPGTHMKSRRGLNSLRGCLTYEVLKSLCLPDDSHAPD